MESAILVLLGVSGIILAGGVMLFLQWKKKPRLSEKEYERVVHLFRKSDAKDPAAGVLECHSIFIKTLQQLRGKQHERVQAATLVKKFAARFPNTKDVWTVHRLRNTIAHEPGHTVSSAQYEQAKKTLLRALRELRG